jgi:hypothetical protein
LYSFCSVASRAAALVDFVALSHMTRQCMFLCLPVIVGCGLVGFRVVKELEQYPECVQDRSCWRHVTIGYLCSAHVMTCSHTAELHLLCVNACHPSPTSRLDLVVVDRKKYFENTTGALRCAVDSLYHKQTSMPHFEWLKEPERLVVGDLIDIAEKAVCVYAYTYACVCMCCAPC